MHDVKDRVAFITGGDGAGIAIAAALGEAGARIVLADANEERLAHGRRHLRERGIEVLALPVSPADRTAMRAAAETVRARLGKVHILIANARQECPGRLCETDERDWDMGLAANLGGVINLVQEFLPILCRQGEGGAILARVPLAGLVPNLAPGPLAVQAGAVVAIMEALSAELRGTGVTASLLIDPAGAPSPQAPGEDFGARVLRGIAARDLYIFAEDVPASIFNDYFETLLAATPADAPAGTPPGGVDPEAMFPVYAAVLRAKAIAAG